MMGAVLIAALVGWACGVGTGVLIVLGVDRRHQQRRDRAERAADEAARLHAGIPGVYVVEPATHIPTTVHE